MRAAETAAESGPRSCINSLQPLKGACRAGAFSVQPKSTLAVSTPRPSARERSHRTVVWSVKEELVRVLCFAVGFGPRKGANSIQCGPSSVTLSAATYTPANPTTCLPASSPSCRDTSRTLLHLLPQFLPLFRTTRRHHLRTRQTTLCDATRLHHLARQFTEFSCHELSPEQSLSESCLTLTAPCSAHQTASPVRVGPRLVRLHSHLSQLHLSQ